MCLPRGIGRWAIVAVLVFMPAVAALNPGNVSGHLDVPDAKCRFCVCGKGRHHPMGAGGFMAAYCPIACGQQIKIATFCDASPLINDDTVLAKGAWAPVRTAASSLPKPRDGRTTRSAEV